MNNFSTNNWQEEKNTPSITDVSGAMKILDITRMTLNRWENRGIITSFKHVYGGRIKKCFDVTSLKKIANIGTHDPSP